jgi:dynein heavy chain
LVDAGYQVIDRETVEANKVKAVVMVEEAAANVKAEASAIIKADTEAELALVMPILESALKVMILLFL